MRSKIYIALFGMVVMLINYPTGNCCAQLKPQFTQYTYNTLAINPAYAGSRGMLSALALSRHQWVGFEGAPQTDFISLHTPIFSENMAIGTTVMLDKIGPTRYQSYNLSYAYHIRISPKAKLSLGLAGVYNNYFNSFGAQTDPLVTNASYNYHLFNAQAGVYLYSDHFFMGVSGNNLIDQNVPDEIQNQVIPQYYGMTGFFIPITTQFALKPSVLLNYSDGNYLSYDANLSLLLGRVIWIGGTYRFNNSYSVMMQYQLSQQFLLGYAYDIYDKNIQQQSSGSHELMLLYELNFKTKKIQNPRYF